jgi:hypothetical protein
MLVLLLLELSNKQVGSMQHELSQIFIEISPIYTIF